MPAGRKKRNNSDYAKLAAAGQDHKQVCICLLNGHCLCFNTEVPQIPIQSIRGTLDESEQVSPTQGLRLGTPSSQTAKRYP